MKQIQKRLVAILLLISLTTPSRWHIVNVPLGIFKVAYTGGLIVGFPLLLLVEAANQMDSGRHPSIIKDVFRMGGNGLVNIVGHDNVFEYRNFPNLRILAGNTGTAATEQSTDLKITPQNQKAFARNIDLAIDGISSLVSQDLTNIAAKYSDSQDSNQMIANIARECADHAKDPDRIEQLENLLEQNGITESHFKNPLFRQWFISSLSQKLSTAFNGNIENMQLNVEEKQQVVNLWEKFTALIGLFQNGSRPLDRDLNKAVDFKIGEELVI